MKVLSRVRRVKLKRGVMFLKRVLVKTARRIRISHMKRVIIGIYVILFLGAMYHIIYARRIIPGIKVGSVSVGGRSYTSAKKKLESYEKSLNKNLVFKYEDKEFIIKPEDISFAYDWDASITRAFEVGRTKNLYVDTKDKLAGILKGLKIGAFYDYNNESLYNQFLTIKGEIDKSAEDSKVVLKDGELEITPSTTGRRIFEEGFYKVVADSFDYMRFGEKTLPVKTVKPRIVEDDLKDVLGEVEKYVFNPMKITFEDQVWKPKFSELLSFIEFTKENKVELTINDATFEGYAESIAEDINRLPRGQVTLTDGARVTGFKIVQEGREVDEKVFSKKFRDAFFAVNDSVEVPVKKVGEGANAESYGIYALLGEGKSKFNGSASARIHNLSLAAERTSGVLVPPGQIYSMSKSIGEVSAQTGYDIAYIIQEGRTVLGEGGGVCQTSTTLFRAVLNSGLPVVMRYPHDYRVGYYEIDSPVGFDASIFQPSLDLQFRNDTPNYVLVQSAVDLPNMTLYFRIYGTPDGRTVEISKPVVTDLVPPPTPLYQDDPTLLKGVVKQIDFSAWGSYVTFNRVVKREDNVLYEDTFSSRYRPWRAIFLVGTRLY